MSDPGITLSTIYDTQTVDICPSTDYVLAATPAGERSSKNELDHVWSTGGDDNYVTFTGGCMASAFTGGVAALVTSRFPETSIELNKMILRNTASGGEWNSMTGWGILDASRAVNLDESQLRQKLEIDPSTAAIASSSDGSNLTVTVRNKGAYDVECALLVAFNGNPLVAADPDATRDKPTTLLTRQLGHSIAFVRGFSETVFDVHLHEFQGGELYLQVCSLDVHGCDDSDTVCVPLAAVDGSAS